MWFVFIGFNEAHRESQVQVSVDGGRSTLWMTYDLLEDTSSHRLSLAALWLCECERERERERDPWAPNYFY